jgi:hypothetical protein
VCLGILLEEIQPIHEYDNGEITFSATDQSWFDHAWANLATTYPVMIDEACIIVLLLEVTTNY